MSEQKAVRAGKESAAVASDQQARPQETPAGPGAEMGALQNAAGNQAVAGAMSATPDGGRPLEGTIRSFMERQFGENFSRVRVHTSGEASASAEALNAAAYTVGHHILFNAGEYQPHSRPGRQLLAHELVHVVQQKKGGPAPRLDPSAGHEQEAARVAAAVNSPSAPGSSLPAARVRVRTGVGISRQTKGKADIKNRFKYERIEKGERIYERTSGELGVPGEVKQHRSGPGQKQVSKGTGDDAGHRAGNRFGASGGPENLARQNWRANRAGGTYYKLEAAWEKKLKRGVRVIVEITDVTRKGEDRPFTRQVRWREITPDGKESKHSLDFANTHTPRSRAAAGLAPQAQSKPATVTNIAGARRRREARKQQPPEPQTQPGSPRKPAPVVDLARERARRQQTPRSPAKQPATTPATTPPQNRAGSKPPAARTTTPGAGPRQTPSRPRPGTSPVPAGGGRPRGQLPTAKSARSRAGRAAAAAAPMILDALRAGLDAVGAEMQKEKAAAAYQRRRPAILRLLLDNPTMGVLVTYEYRRSKPAGSAKGVLEPGPWTFVGIGIGPATEEMYKQLRSGPPPPSLQPQTWEYRSVYGWVPPLTEEQRAVLLEEERKQQEKERRQRQQQARQQELKDRLRRAAERRQKQSPAQKPAPPAGPPSLQPAPAPPQYSPFPGMPPPSNRQQARRAVAAAERWAAKLLHLGESLQRRLGSGKRPTPAEIQAYVDKVDEWKTALEYLSNEFKAHGSGQQATALDALLDRYSGRLDQYRIHLGK